MSDAAKLAELLTELKQRHGSSYSTIGKKVNASKSAVARYCTGQSVPPEFGTIERIARACNARPEETARLFQLWTQAGPVQAVRSGTGTGTNESGNGAVAEAPPDATAQAPRTDPPRPGTRGQRGKVALLAGASMVLLLVGLTVFTSSGHGRSRSEETAQQITGPAWTMPPAAVPRTLFGVTINSSTGADPTFQVGSVRFWDSGTRWAEIQPARGEFDWSVLDRHVGSAQRDGLPALFVFGGTPGWASPEGAMGPYPDGTRASPPDHLADWDHFVSAVVHHYRGRIAAYELWVLANDRHFFSGSVATLVDMTRRASRIIRTADPKATVVCPGMGNLWTSSGQQMMLQFARLGGYRYCDVASVKLYQRRAADPPETMLSLITTIDRIFHQAGVQPPLWDTGTTYSIPLEKPLDDATAADYAVRFFLVGIYARDYNLQRMYFYNWGGRKIPVVLQVEGGAPTRAARSIAQLEAWLAHAQSISCGHGESIGLPDNVWQCEFTISEPGQHYDASIRWTDTGTAVTEAGPGTRAVRTLEGTTIPARIGDAIPVSQDPVLIEY